MTKILTALFCSLWISSNLMAETIRVSAVGQWSENYQAPLGVSNGWTWDAHVWLDIIVDKMAYGKTVGVIWTIDDWKTIHTDLANYDGPAGGNDELWSLDFKATEMKSCFGCENSEVELQYAVFARLGEREIWSNNNGVNYNLIIESEYLEGDPR